MRIRGVGGACLFVASLAVSAGGCTTTPNAADLFPDAGAATDEDAEVQPEPSGSTEDASRPSPSEDASTGCGPGAHACDARCAPNDDPATGCGDPSCLPCAIAHGTARCVAEACAIAQCDPGRADCNGDPADGCEADITSDPRHCGACTTACGPTQVCGPSGCAQTCSGGLTNCSGACVDTTSDPDHCGTCARACPAPAAGYATCDFGACGIACDPFYHACGGACVAENAKSCGPSCTACPHPAHSTAACDHGACGFTCNAGYETCPSGKSCCAIDAGPRDAGRDATTDANDGGDAGDDGGACVSFCSTDTECQNSCPATAFAISCCDTGSHVCYASQTSSCPTTTPDAGPPGPY